MHSRIFQITTKPVDKENYLNEFTLNQGENSFIDYCDEIDDEEREANIVCLVGSVLPKGMFTRMGANVIRYNGGMQQWKEEAIAKIKEKLAAITPDNYFWIEHYNLKKAVENPLDAAYLFYTDEKGTQSWAEESYEFMQFVSRLEEGTLLYIGGVIDYHF